MSNMIMKEMEWAGSKISLETGRIAKQTSASVIVKYNNTTVLVTVVTGKGNSAFWEKKSGVGLVVNFVYKAYARCKIPGGFIKREGKSTEREILASRVIDRAIRPLFPDGFSDEVYVVCSLLTHDGSIIPEIPSLIGASAALNISEVPFLSPVVGAHLGYDGAKYQLNSIQEGSTLDLIVAGTLDSILMVESEAKELAEDVILDGIMFGHESVKPVINFINEFSDAVGRKEKILTENVINDKITQLVKNKCESKISEAYSNPSKHKRCEILDVMKSEFLSELPEEEIDVAIKELQKLEKGLVRENIIRDNQRIDGRKDSEIRNIDIVTDVLPQTHGSALFTRGGTQALVVLTLGDQNDEQIIDGVDGNRREDFMLHYNFPPYSVGEASPLRPPSRREVGHGRLAWRALQSVLIDKNKFPYTVRVVSEITESDGSSSMATVCGSSLALMVGGVPIKSHVAGIAMGLIKEGDECVVLSDISGDEDNFGDMDFKVTGTNQGVTALQMDIKIFGINKDIIQPALEQARIGRLHILDKMNAAIAQSNENLKDNAPRITSLQINPDDINKVIGTGGRVVKNICEVTGSKVDISPDGKVVISADNSKSMKTAKEMIDKILAVPKTGIVYSGSVTGIAQFGVFVKFLADMEGLVHVSQIQDKHTDSVEDIMKIGDKVKVLVLSIDRDNKVRLSMKHVDQKSGEIFSEDYAGALRSEQDRGGGNNARRINSNNNHHRGHRGSKSSGDRRGDYGGGEKRDYKKGKRPKFF